MSKPRIYIENENEFIGKTLKQKLGDTFSKQEFIDLKAEQVYLPLQNVGGTFYVKSRPASTMAINLQKELDNIFTAHLSDAKLLYVAPSCVYPRDAPQPLKEESLLTGKLEPSCEYYALAELMGIKLCQAYRKQYGCNFISVISSGVYGPHDDFDPLSSHVIGALIRKFYEADKHSLDEVVVWGTGKPKRDFVYVDDVADAMIFLMENYNDGEPINIGSGEDISIEDLAWTIAKISGFEGDLTFDKTKPDGVMRKMLDTSKMDELGWKPKIDLSNGLQMSYRWFCDNYEP